MYSLETVPLNLKSCADLTFFFGSHDAQVHQMKNQAPSHIKIPWNAGHDCIVIVKKNGKNFPSFFKFATPSKHSAHVNCRASMHVRLRVLAVWTLKVLVFLRRVGQDDFRHPLVESFLSVVALNLLQPTVVSLGVLHGQRWAHGSITFSETPFFLFT